MSGNSADSAPEGGLRGVVSATLWAAGSVGAITAVAMWAFDLGSRNPADVPALVAQGDWRARPADAQGRRLPGQDRLVYAPIADQPGAAAASVVDVISGAPTERAPREDLSGVPPLPEIAADRAEPMSSSDFTALSGAAASVTDANDRRSILLDDPVAPRRDSRDLAAAAPPALPPNVGTGAEPAPPNAVFYRPGADVGDMRSGLVLPPAAGPSRSAVEDASDQPPAADAAAMDAPPDALPPAEMAPTAPPPAAQARPKPAEPPRAAFNPVAPEPAAPKPAEPQTAEQPPADSPPGDTLIASAPAAAAPTESAPEAPASYQVQLGALDSVEAAERRWAYLQKKVPGILGVYKLDIQPVNVGGARLYRLRIGAFSSRAGAAELCGALRLKGVDCFPASG